MLHYLPVQSADGMSKILFYSFPVLIIIFMMEETYNDDDEVIK